MQYASPKYVPLRVHTDFSILSSSITPKKLIDYAKKHGLYSIAITDSNNLFAAAEYSFYARSQKYPAILGTCLKTEYGNVLLYCKNEIGYKNLCKILTDFYVLFDGNHVPLKHLEGLTDGLACLSGGVDGVIQGPHAAENLIFLQNSFSDSFALELNRTEGKHNSEQLICALSAKYHVPVVGTSVAHFIDNQQAYQVLKALRDGEVISLNNKEIDQTNKLLTEQEFEELFADCPIVIENTLLFAQKCAFLVKPIKPRFAFFAENAESLLRKWAKEGLDSLMEKDNWKESSAAMFSSMQEAKDCYYQRLNYELDMIEQMGFTHYFLIVADFVKWSRDQKISLAARGSGGGSLVAWALFITVIDPIVFGLFFERFINPGRVSLPDFDIDFCQDRRGEVIAYVKNKYGADKVAHIITFGVMHAKGVLKDVGRVLGLPYKLVDNFSRRVPSGPNIFVTLSQVLESDEEMQKQASSDQKIQTLFDISLALEGVHRNISIHAAGIVIGDAPLNQLLPLYKTQDMNIPATQYTMNFIEKVGLVKFDFLGLTALTIIDKVLVKLEQKNIIIDINHIKYNDTKVFDFINKGFTCGVFQLETAGLTDVILKMQPNSLEDWTAAVSLFRPGPIQNIPEFIARKQGLTPITYDYPALEPILKNTYGIIVYQEQVIAIARDLAGYSLSEADLLRRAMGKKDADEMKKNKDIFVANFVQRQGCSEEGAATLFENIERFSGYAFNKSHAACYAFIIYQNAYLKTYYLPEFMSVSMTMEKQKHDKISSLGAELNVLGLMLLQPDINKPSVEFEIESRTNIRYCLSAIKGVGDAWVQELVSKNMQFKSIEEFCFAANINKKIFQALILAGALDTLPIYNSTRHNKNIHIHRNQIITLQEQLLAGAGASIFESEWQETFDINQLLVQEFKTTGVIFSLQELEKLLLIDGKISVSNSILEQQKFITQGIVVNKDLIKTRSGATQWAVKLVDAGGLYEVFVKNELESALQIQEGMILKIYSKKIRTFWIAEKVEKIVDVVHPKLLIEIKNQQQLTQIHSIISQTETGRQNITLLIDKEALEIGFFKVNQDMFEKLDQYSIRYKMQKEKENKKMYESRL